MASKIDFSIKTLNEIKHLYTTTDHTCVSLSKIYGCSNSKIKRVLLAEGLSIKSRKVSDAEILNICTLYKKGKTENEISELVGYNRSVVNKILNNNAIERNERKHIIDKESICDLYKYSCENSVTLAEKFNCSQATIAKILKNSGIVLKKDGKRIKDQISIEEEKEIVDYYATNINSSLVTLSKKYGYTPKAIRDTLLKNKIKIRPLNIISEGEKEIVEYIKSIGLCPEENNKKLIGKELDIIIHDRKIAVEFDGLYWHSEIHKNNNYHINKTNLCVSKGYQLIHVFEDEWYNKQEIVKSLIRNKVLLTDSVYVRRCAIKEIDYDTTNSFLLNNHIQGCTPSKINIGLYYNNELISIMTFGKPRYNKKYNWELLRFCNKINMRIIGGAGKLFSYFIKNYKGSIISYCDLRYGTGKMYEKIGMVFSHNTQPNYWYVNRGNYTRESRLKYQKHKLKKLFPDIYSDNKSESQIMNEAGYYKIYDCGNSVWVYNP